MNIEIKIVPEKERKAEIHALSERITKGIITQNKRTLILTPELFSKVFSPKRIELLMTLAKKQEYNITDLAKSLKRKFEVVHRDLKMFEHFGLVRLIKEDKSIIPELTGQIRLPTIA